MNTQDLIALADKIIASVPIYGDGVESMAYRTRLVQAALAAAQPKGEEPHWHSCERLLPHDWAMNTDGSFTCVRCQLHQPKADERGSAEPDESEIHEILDRWYWGNYSSPTAISAIRKAFTAPARDGSEPGLREALTLFAGFKPHQAPRGVSSTVWSDYLRKAQKALAATPEQRAEPQWLTDAQMFDLWNGASSGTGLTPWIQQVNAALAARASAGRADK